MELTYDKPALQEYMDDIGCVGESVRRAQDESFSRYNACKQHYARLHTQLEEELRRAQNQMAYAESLQREADTEYSIALSHYQSADEDSRMMAEEELRRAEAMQEAAKQEMAAALEAYEAAQSKMNQLVTVWETHQPTAEAAAHRVEDGSATFGTLVCNANRDLGEYMGMMDKAQDALYEGTGAAASSSGTSAASSSSGGGNALRYSAAGIAMCIGGKEMTFPNTKSGIAKAHRTAVRSGDGELAKQTGELFASYDGTDWERTSLTPEQEAQVREMEAAGELEIPQEDPNWKEPIQAKPHLPSEETGRFDGERGNSNFYPNNEAALAKMREYGSDHVAYKNGHPDFSPFTQHDTPYGKMDSQVEIGHMTTHRENPTSEYGRRPAGTKHDPHYELGNFAQADVALSQRMGNMTPQQVAAYRQANGLTWHECADGKTMQLVPTAIHDACRHSGGVSEMRFEQAMGNITAPIS